jgi:hypothetical protein
MICQRRRKYILRWRDGIDYLGKEVVWLLDQNLDHCSVVKILSENLSRSSRRFQLKNLTDEE